MTESRYVGQNGENSILKLTQNMFYIQPKFNMKNYKYKQKNYIINTGIGLHGPKINIDRKQIADDSR